MANHPHPYADLFPMMKGEGSSIETASKALNVSVASTKRAKQVKEQDPEAFEKVKAGEQTVGGAASALNHKQETRTRTEADKDRLLSAWDKSCPEGRDEFLKTIGV